MTNVEDERDASGWSWVDVFAIYPADEAWTLAHAGVARSELRGPTRFSVLTVHVYLPDDLAGRAQVLLASQVAFQLWKRDQEAEDEED